MVSSMVTPSGKAAPDNGGGCKDHKESREGYPEVLCWLHGKSVWNSELHSSTGNSYALPAVSISPGKKPVQGTEKNDWRAESKKRGESCKGEKGNLIIFEISFRPHHMIEEKRVESHGRLRGYIYTPWGRKTILRAVLKGERRWRIFSFIGQALPGRYQHKVSNWKWSQIYMTAIGLHGSASCLVRQRLLSQNTFFPSERMFPGMLRMCWTRWQAIDFQR